MEHFVYVEELRLLGCRECQILVTQKQLALHLRKAPHNLSKEEIKAAQKWSSSYDIFQNQIQACERLQPRPDIAPPIAALGPPGTGGFRCEFVPKHSPLPPECRSVGANLRRIREHLKFVHKWDKRLKGGRRSAVVAEEEQSNCPWRAGVYYQQLFVRGVGSDLFEVARGHDLAQSICQSIRSQAELQRAIDAFESKGKDIRRREAEHIDAQDESAAPNPWLRRLGSAFHLKDFSGKKDFLRGLISMEYEDEVDSPDKSDDAQLRFIHMAFDRLVAHAKATITPDVVSWNALFEVNRKELAKERDKPFHFRFKPGTQDKYALVIKQFLAYIVRCLSLDDEKDRPPFKLSERQQTAYDTMMEHADDLDDVWKKNGEDETAPEVSKLFLKLEDSVLELYISVLDHFTKDTEYDSVLVSFLTVLSVRSDGNWEGVDNFPPKLSAIMAMSRLCIIKYAVDKRARSIEEKKEQGQSQEEAEEHSPSNFALISEMTRRFMVGGGEGWETTPTQFIIRLRNFGMAAHNNTAAPGSISWDKEVVNFKGIRLSVIDVQTMMRVAVQELEDLLYKDLLFCDKYPGTTPTEAGVPAIPWDDIIDNAADETIGHSFVDKLYQHDGGASKNWLIRKIIREDRLRAVWVKSMDAGTELHSNMAYQYGLHVEKAQELLAYLAQLGGGFPVRAYDLFAIRHRNTANGGVRNIFMDKGIIMLVTGVNKSFSMTERVKIVHRFLPREVGTLLVYYSWLVLSFWEDVQANVWDRSSFDAEIWPIGNNPQFDSTAEDEDAGDRAESSQSRSSQDEQQQTQRNKWPGKRWTSARLSRIICRRTLAACDQKLNISSWRHISTAIGRRYFRNAATAHVKLLPDVDSDGSGSDSDDEQDSPYDLQAGHGSRVAGMIYGRLVTEGAFETNERRVNFRYISEEWHRLLGFPSATSGFGEVLTPGRKRKRVTVHDEALRDLQLKRWKVRRRIDIDRQLTRMYGDQAEFRGVQRKAIEAVMMNKSPIVVVMGTGGGKSLCFMLPAASCPGGVTVVVVPLVSLQGDLMERCRQMRIPCAEWRSDRSPGSASLVFVTPESAMTKRFGDYIEGLRITAQLDGFVVDEAHTILEGSKEFRPKLAELGQLALVGVQMVYFTATLPPSKEDDFFGLTHIRRGDVVMIRSRTTRTNVAYSVRTVAAKSAEEATETMTAGVRTLLDEKLQQYPWPAKMIVYCRTVDATKALATGLECDAYHRDIDTRDGKAERLRAWMSGTIRGRYGGGRVIVATNALGLGIDVPDIRVVVHVDMPFEMADYAQQSGRAGRDGQRSEAIVLQIATNSGGNQPRRSQYGRSSSDDFTSGEMCRRVALDSMMDGRLDREACEEGEEACDICATRDSRGGVTPSEDEEEVDMRRHEIDIQMMRSRARSKAAAEAREMELFRQRLQERLLSGCTFCNPPGAGRHDIDHTSMDCGMSRAAGDRSRKVLEMGFRLRAYMRRQGAAERFSCCYECFVPQEMCDRWEEDEVQGGWRRLEGGDCQYKGVMESTIAFVYTSLPEEAEELFVRLGLSIEAGDERCNGRVKESQVWRWMGRRIDWGGMEASNMCRVFMHMAGTDGY